MGKYRWNSFRDESWASWKFWHFPHMGCTQWKEWYEPWRERVQRLHPYTWRWMQFKDFIGYCIRSR